MNSAQFNIGGVMVDIKWKSNIEKYHHKFKVLRMAMDNWAKKNCNISTQSIEYRLYSKDCDKFNELKTLLTTLYSVSDPDIIMKRTHMKLMNEMFRRYN